MLNQFSRFELLVGTEKVNKLHKMNVLVFGLGGVGGHVVDGLVRSGVGNFTIVDNDIVSLTNLNRQLIANYKSIGKAKTEVMKEHILSINPEAKVNCVNEFFLKKAESSIDFNNFDYVIDAIDTVSAKIEIAKICYENDIPLISAMGCGNKLDPSKIEVTDIFKTSYDPLCKVMRKKLKELGIKKLKVVYSIEEPIKPLNDEIKKEENVNKRSIPGSSAFVPSVAGLTIASVVVRELLEKIN